MAKYLNILSIPSKLAFQDRHIHLYMTMILSISTFDSLRKYPEYYETIKRPVDFTTIKNRLNTYPTLSDVLADLRLIWENCRFYNAEGSDIYGWADTLAAVTEDLIEVPCKAVSKRSPALNQQP